MVRARFFLLFSLSLVLFCGCRKQNNELKCTELSTAMLSGNPRLAVPALMKFIKDLPSQEYTAANLDRLVQSIQANCSFSAEVLCFSCIMTLPEQSEIRVSFINNGSPVHKIVDLSHPTGSNLMKVISMHN